MPTLVWFFDLAKILDLVKFVFFDLYKLSSKPLSTIFITLAPITIKVDFDDLNIEVRSMAIFLSLEWSSNKNWQSLKIPKYLTLTLA